MVVGVWKITIAAKSSMAVIQLCHATQFHGGLAKSHCHRSWCQKHICISSRKPDFGAGTFVRSLGLNPGARIAPLIECTRRKGRKWRK